MAAVKEQEAARYAQQMALERESMQKHYEDKLAKLHGKVAFIVCERATQLQQSPLRRLAEFPEDHACRKRI